MIRAILVDDEKSGRETLQFVLEKFFASRVQVVSMAASVKEAALQVEKYHPDLVFLDIEMPNEMGLSLVNAVEKVDFEIIVTTAHKAYGIEAIKAGVLDYLLKPVDLDELKTALDKLEKKLESRLEENTVRKLLGQLTAGNTPPSKIPILISTNKTLFVEAASIIRLEADGNYTRIWFDSGKSELVTRLMKEMEELLVGHPFFRVHKSHVINLQHVRAFQKLDDDITMSDHSTVPLSRNLKSDFLARMKME